MHLPLLPSTPAPPPPPPHTHVPKAAFQDDGIHPTRLGRMLLTDMLLDQLLQAQEHEEREAVVRSERF